MDETVGHICSQILVGDSSSPGFEALSALEHHYFSRQHFAVKSVARLSTLLVELKTHKHPENTEGEQTTTIKETSQKT